jgi:hypothetical protein
MVLDDDGHTAVGHVDVGADAPAVAVGGHAELGGTYLALIVMHKALLDL